MLISDSILVAVGAGVAQGATSTTLGIALLAMFALATFTGLMKRKISSDNTPNPPVNPG